MKTTLTTVTRKSVATRADAAQFLYTLYLRYMQMAFNTEMPMMTYQQYRTSIMQ